MKKVISIILCAVLLLCGLQTFAFASDANDEIMPCYNNAAVVESSFNIVNGNAKVLVSYTGYAGVTTGARITIQLQKRNLLVFWKDVTEWEEVSYNAVDMFEHSYPVSSGTYRVKIRCEISGSGGATDVIEKELQDSY